MAGRREVVKGGLAAMLLPFPRRVAAQPPEPSTSVAFPVPQFTCDCHAHIFGDPALFPLSPNRTYTPNVALPSDLQRVHRSLGVTRVVVVTPSAYGTDNRATLFGVTARGNNARAVVVIDPQIGNAELEQLHEGGARGARLFLGNSTDTAAATERFRALAGRIKGLGWHVQIFSNPSTIAALRPAIIDVGVPVVIDHFGGARGELGPQQDGFSAIVELVSSGIAYVKLSAPYRFSHQPPHFADMLPLAQMLTEANPERVLWATDWPHTAGDIAGRKPTDIAPFIPVDDGQIFNLFAGWVPDGSMRMKILVENPERLYGF